jgi:hypothetical protein
MGKMIVLTSPTCPSCDQSYLETCQTQTFQEHFPQINTYIISKETMGRVKKAYEKNIFKKGHTYFGARKSDKNVTQADKVESKWVPRLPVDKFNKVTTQNPSGIITVTDAEGKMGTSKFLRPAPLSEEKDILGPYMKDLSEFGPGEMRMYERDRIFDMWNESLVKHSYDKGQRCPVPIFKCGQEVKWGLCWKMSVCCSKCNWKSGLFNLYKEVETQSRGPKAAAPNMALQVGLQDTTTGNTKARAIIAAINTPPPSRSSMQRMSNKVGAIICDMNEKDMKEKRNETKQINVLRGLSKDSPINVAMDVRYNSNTFGGRHKMGQNASQAIGICTEGQSDSKEIVGLHVENKLCWKGSWLRNKGVNVSCPGGHKGCTATVSESTTLSEYQIGKKIGQQLARDKINIKYVTTDGDARSAEGLQTGLNTEGIPNEVTRLADTTHLSQAQFRQAAKAKFSGSMFPGPTSDKQVFQKLFAQDLRFRCNKIYTTMYETYAGDTGKMASKMPSVIDATILCYSGSCAKCRRGSIVCAGGKKKNWWGQSIYLNRRGLTQGSINMTENDEIMLRSLINVRLGKKALESTRLNTNTNKNEAANRALSASLPKNVNFARNARARANSAVHRLNHGAGCSTILKLEAVGCPVSKGGRVARAVRQIQHEYNYQRAYKKRKEVRQRKLLAKSRQIHAYMKAKQEKRDLYLKGHLDTSLHVKAIQHTMRQPLNDHTYSLRIRTDHTYAKK